MDPKGRDRGIIPWLEDVLIQGVRVGKPHVVQLVKILHREKDPTSQDEILIDAIVSDSKYLINAVFTTRALDAWRKQQIAWAKTDWDQFIPEYFQLFEYSFEFDPRAVILKISKFRYLSPATKQPPSPHLPMFPLDQEARQRLRKQHAEDDSKRLSLWDPIANPFTTYVPPPQPTIVNVIHPQAAQAGSSSNNNDGINRSSGGRNSLAHGGEEEAEQGREGQDDVVASSHDEVETAVRDSLLEYVMRAEKSSAGPTVLDTSHSYIQADKVPDIIQFKPVLASDSSSSEDHEEEQQHQPSEEHGHDMSAQTDMLAVLASQMARDSVSPQRSPSKSSGSPPLLAPSGTVAPEPSSQVRSSRRAATTSSQQSASLEDSMDFSSPPSAAVRSRKTATRTQQQAPSQNVSGRKTRNSINAALSDSGRSLSFYFLKHEPSQAALAASSGAGASQDGNPDHSIPKVDPNISSQSGSGSASGSSKTSDINKSKQDSVLSGEISAHQPSLHPSQEQVMSPPDTIEIATQREEDKDAAISQPIFPATQFDASIVPSQPRAWTELAPGDSLLAASPPMSPQNVEKDHDDITRHSAESSPSPRGQSQTQNQTAGHSSVRRRKRDRENTPEPEPEPEPEPVQAPVIRKSAFTSLVSPSSPQVARKVHLDDSIDIFSDFATKSTPQSATKFAKRIQSSDEQARTPSRPRGRAPPLTLMADDEDDENDDLLSPSPTLTTAFTATSKRRKLSDAWIEANDVDLFDDLDQQQKSPKINSSSETKTGKNRKREREEEEPPLPEPAPVPSSMKRGVPKKPWSSSAESVITAPAPAPAPAPAATAARNAAVQVEHSNGEVIFTINRPREDSSEEDENEQEIIVATPPPQKTRKLNAPNPNPTPARQRTKITNRVSVSSTTSTIVTSSANAAVALAAAPSPKSSLAKEPEKAPSTRKEKTTAAAAAATPAKVDLDKPIKAIFTPQHHRERSSPAPNVEEQRQQQPPKRAASLDKPAKPVTPQQQQQQSYQRSSPSPRVSPPILEEEHWQSKRAASLEKPAKPSSPAPRDSPILAREQNPQQRPSLPKRTASSSSSETPSTKPTAPAFDEYQPPQHQKPPLKRTVSLEKPTKPQQHERSSPSSRGAPSLGLQERPISAPSSSSSSALSSAQKKVPNLVQSKISASLLQKAPAPAPVNAEPIVQQQRASPQVQRPAPAPAPKVGAPKAAPAPISVPGLTRASSTTEAGAKVPAPAPRKVDIKSLLPPDVHFVRKKSSVSSVADLYKKP